MNGEGQHPVMSCSSPDRPPTRKQHQKPHPLSVATTSTWSRLSAVTTPLSFHESPSISPTSSCKLKSSHDTPRSGATRGPACDGRSETLLPWMSKSFSASEVVQKPGPTLFNLDSPEFPLHVISHQHDHEAANTDSSPYSHRNELLCCFRAAHRPPSMRNPSDPLNLAAYGEVVTDTPEHLHINVRFEYLHMMNAIKQTWVERHVQPDIACILMLGDCVLGTTTQALHVQRTESEGLIEVLMPRAERTGAKEDSRVPQKSNTLAATREIPFSGHARRASTSAPPTANVESQTSKSARTKMVDASTQTEEPSESTADSTSMLVAREEESPASESTTADVVMTEPQSPGSAREGLMAARHMSPKKVKSWADIARRQ